MKPGLLAYSVDSINRTEVGGLVNVQLTEKQSAEWFRVGDLEPDCLWSSCGPITHFKALGKLLHLGVPPFLICKMGMMMIECIS